MKTRIPRSQVVKSSWLGALAGIGAAAALALGSSAYAGEAAPAVHPAVQDVQSTSQSGLAELRALIELQRQQIEAQRERIEALEATTNNLEKITLSLFEPSAESANYVPQVTGAAQYGQGSEGYAYSSGAIQPALYPVLPQLGGTAAQPQGRRYAQAESEETQAPAGQATPQDEKPPEVTLLAERGGVLTPRGTVVVEPSIKWSKSTSNRLNFRGISIVEGFLVGIIEATDADRDTVTAALTGRYGITDRLEVEVEVPYVYRSDRTTSLVKGAGGPAAGFTLTDELTSNDIGDVEVAAHYQINRGRGGWPFFVGNLRFKSTTGTGPFDVSRQPAAPPNPGGAPTELATGSGFYGVEPSITVLFPTDPAVLFANVGYLWNVEDDVNETVGGSVIGTVDPGDSLSLSFGVGFALNEKLSLSLGYQHDFVGETTTEIDTVEVDSDTLSVGSFLFGASYRLNDWLGFNLTTQIGATEDAPDVQLLLRVPIRFSLF